MKELALCLGTGSSICPPTCPAYETAKEITNEARAVAAAQQGIPVEKLEFDLKKTETVVQTFLATHPYALEMVYAICLRKRN